MKSKVYFIRLNDKEEDSLIRAKFSRLLNKSDLFGFINRVHAVVIKTHFGEEGAERAHISSPHKRVKLVADCP